MFHYCLITDKNYINSTICLINKILPKSIHVLCLDDYVEEFLNTNFKNISIYKLQTLEKKYNLNSLKENRDRRSYVFTLKSYFLDYLMNYIDANEHLVYLDSDLYFFSECEKLEKSLTSSSVHISPHNFDSKNSHREIYGKFNAGLLVFKNDYDGKKVLTWWMEKCLENCSLDVTQDVYADQKYLNNFSKISSNIKIINNPGINLAPWNIKTFGLT